MTWGARLRRGTSALLGVLLAASGCADEQGGSGSTPTTSVEPPVDAGGGGTRPEASTTTDAGVDASDGGAGWPEGFVPTPQNVPSGQLCNIPDDYVANGGDPVNPPCELESDRFSDRDRFDVPNALRWATWNVEWGRNADLVLDLLATDPGLGDIDILMLQEVPRHDQEGTVPGINLTREIAQQQQLDYVFAVEWDRRENADEGGEHGLAILSKYPIGNASLIRHTPCYDHYSEKGHYGGRATLAVDLAIGDRRVRVYDAHYATRDVDGTCRAMQGDEVLADAHLPTQPVVQLLGGDFNTVICTPLLHLCNDPSYAEAVVRALQLDSWTDLLPTFT
ncbi:MAG: endonuclease/exonuclease/phosphatase family protein, partial [Deltaproteobacteria bacterium]|nr:endonuclease/exonuclease/phosphatase family protein [Deltaproteobacteria bacterium]MBW2530429.1 endonuclease/exonuclease/phosphatase family protein [Deltaproteobacteria bacterium]